MDQMGGNTGVALVSAEGGEDTFKKLGPSFNVLGPILFILFLS